MRVSVVIGADLSHELRVVIRRARLGPLLRSGGDACGVPARASLTIRLTDDAELRALNAGFRNVDSATDVLAFPAEEVDYVGDIAVSVERAVAQAPAEPSLELRLLAVHGLLHCLGHDHAESAEAARMSTEMRRLLPGQDVPELLTAGDS